MLHVYRLLAMTDEMLEEVKKIDLSMHTELLADIQKDLNLEVSQAFR